ncbi:MAG: NUDIX hydrolase [Candidatus Dormibacterales bacterium]
MPGYRILARRRAFEGRALSVDVDRVARPDGVVIERETVRRSGAVAVVAVTREGLLPLVRQYRHAADRELLELPAGLLEPGEEPGACAARELREESGLIASRLDLLTAYYSTAGSSDERVWVYLARGCEEGGERDLDPDEQLDLVQVRAAEAVRMARSGEIEDAKTIIGLLLAEPRLD